MNTSHQNESLPAQVARGWQSREGLAFLDSSLEATGSISLLAVEPDLVLEGTDWGRLEHELECRQRQGPDLGYPDGAAIGWVDFDGGYRFGFYDTVHVFLHDQGSWVNPPDLNVHCPSSHSGRIKFLPQIERTEFIELVARARRYIEAGDIYQVCLSHPFFATTGVSAWDYYERLRHYSPAPFAAYLDCGRRQIASASPECFLRIGGRSISTHPIKGTRPRGSDAQIDQRNAYDLITSAKEVAELVMITDLERNDLGRVCEFGSITVPDLLRLERFEQVFHLVSTVQGHLRDDVSHAQALKACAPGGSISGAPKKRALEIIRELERFPRGLYTGAIGYLGYNGESQFSIAIRTAVFEQGHASFHVGAGIVADSDPEAEWQETIDKAAGLLLAAT